MMNASNFQRNVYTREAMAQLPEPKQGTRPERRKALAIARRTLSTKGVLDAQNEQRVGSVMHPTRGLRKVSEKRSRAATIAEMTRQGYGMSTQETKEALLGQE